MKKKPYTARVFISTKLSAADVALHHLTPRLIVHMAPEWTSHCRPTCFQPVGR